MKTFARPRLAAHVRYRFDETRKQHQLVYPEGMLVLNETAAAVVQVCDGRTEEEMLAALREKFGKVPKRDVAAFLASLDERRLLDDGSP